MKDIPKTPSTIFVKATTNYSALKKTRIICLPKKSSVGCDNDLPFRLSFIINCVFSSRGEPLSLDAVFAAL
jgi:hypothetical protein